MRPLVAGGFFHRSRLELPRRDAGYLTAEAPNADAFLYGPVMQGYWKQRELWDGTYTLDDLLDITELIRVRRENEARAMEVNRCG